MSRRARLRPSTAAAVAASLSTVLVLGLAVDAGAEPTERQPGRFVPLPLAPATPDPVPCPGCWHPEPGTTWQWQLQGRIDRSFDVRMYGVDLFDVPAGTVEALHDDGRVVICYVSAGSWENWRPDAERYPDDVLGKALDGWPGERWVDVRRLDVLGPILKKRMDRCVDKGFDGVEFDNVDGYTNDSGFALAPKDQLRFNVWLANQAHRRGLSVGLKNDLAQVGQLEPYFDWALNEQCFQYHECWRLAPFVDAGEAVFHVEYELARSQFCPRSADREFSSLRKRYSLGPWRRAC